MLMRYQFGELQVRIAIPERLSMLEEVLDAFADHLDADTEFVDGTEISKDEACVFLYGPDLDRLILVARRVLAEFGVAEGADMVPNFPSWSRAAEHRTVQAYA